MIKIPEIAIRPIAQFAKYIGFPPFIAIIPIKHLPIPTTIPIYYECILSHCFMDNPFGIIILRTKDGKRFNSLESFYADKENIKLIKEHLDD